MPQAPSINLVVGTAAFGGQVTNLYTHSMLHLEEACAARNIELAVVLQVGDALIQRARQQIVARFLELPSATHFLMVDSDIGFEPEQVFRLLDADKDFVAAAYPQKRIPLSDFHALSLNGHPDPAAASLSYDFESWQVGQAQIQGGFSKARWVGAGFMLLKRSALLAMIQRYPELHYSGSFISGDNLSQDLRYALFGCILDKDSGTYLSEDRSFCRRWTDMGGEIWVDVESRLQHVGIAVFRGYLAAKFRTGAGPDSLEK